MQAFTETEFTLEKVLSLLKRYQNDQVLNSMQRFGLPTANAIGVRNPDIKSLSKVTGKNHLLAIQLWESGILEAQLLATLIADYKMLTPVTMDSWITKINSWSVCDTVCSNVFWKTKLAYEKAIAWSRYKPEYEKRAGFALMAMLAVHDKKADDEKLLPFFICMEEEAWDERNFVKKAINWALRSMGKRSFFLYDLAMNTAEKIGSQKTPSAKWIASDALRELRSEAIIKRLTEKESKK